MIVLDQNMTFNESDLISILKNYDVDISGWGQGRAKTIGHLVSEIRDGDAVLLNNDGILTRKLHIARAAIFYEHEEINQGRYTKTIYFLVEDRQVFKDGRIRYRAKISDTSVAEKMMPTEDSLKAILRGIEEELSLSIKNFQLIEGPRVKERKAKSCSYPNLKSHHVLNDYVLRMLPCGYNPYGYLEEQDDKTTYFVWEEVKTKERS